MLAENLPKTPVYSVSDLTAYVRAVLESNENLLDIWVSGELSNVSKPSSGHIYFTLKDAFSSLRCVIWRENARLLQGALHDGMAVEAHGYVGVYEQGGQYQLYVDGLRAAGEGMLYQEYLRLKSILEAEGLFDEERKQKPPAFPKIIGVVASRTSAAFQDILNTLRARFPLAQVVLAHTSVQGDIAPKEIVAALGRLNKFAKPDVILVARGGGSLEDLWSFNDENVVRAVAASRTPVISGIGHETDFTLVDFAADLRAPTPTGAAVMAVPDIQELYTILREMENSLVNSWQSYINDLSSTLRFLGVRLEQTRPERRIRDRGQRLDDLFRRLLIAREVFFGSRTQQLRGLVARMHALNPENVIQRGYALLSDAHGKSISSVKQVQLHQKIDIRLKDGGLSAEVQEKRLKKRNKNGKS